MASRSSQSTSPPPTTTNSTNTTSTTKAANHVDNNTREESFLSRKKKEIVDRSMALFQLHLDRCLDNSAAAAAAISSGSSTSTSATPAGAGAVGVGARRRVKRGREEDDYEHEHGDNLHGEGGGGGKGAGGGKGVGVKKKRGNPKEAEDKKPKGKRFACPFCKHDPGKYKSVKTCCGPGWENVHRVKEHIYRRHSWKSTRVCPRCFEGFDKPELLKAHQRASDPCELRERAPDDITEEQEKQLRARAKSNSSEEMKWEEMYQIIFPGETVPSPYYESEADVSHKKAGKSAFQDIDEAKEFLRTEIPRLVRPEIEQYVHTLFEEVQQKVHQKTAEIIRNVETKVLLTFHFHGEQAASVVSGHDSAEPSPPPSPAAAAGSEMASSKIGQLLEVWRDDHFMSELLDSVPSDLESYLAESHGLAGCDVFSQDSAYYTSSSSGGQGPYSLGGEEYLQRY